MDEAREIRDFWFGRLPIAAADFPERMRAWFGGEDEAAQRRHDDMIRSRFGGLLERAARGELEGWADSPRRRLSLILVLDQFSRNIYRGTARAFTHDGHALMLTMSGMHAGADAALEPIERMFFYMPMQHAESLDVQDEAVTAFRRLVDDAPEDVRASFAECLKYAEHHRSIVQRFGRFPHRNRVMGRASTPEERAWLANGGESFGQ